jgi:hypothetical protein
MAGWCDGEYACNGKLEIGVGLYPLNCPAWDIVNLAPLWIEDEFRGENLALPRIPGARAFPKRLAQAEHDLVLWMRGDSDKDGVAHPEVWQGLSDNIDALKANVIDPPAAPTAIRSATLTLPDGVTTRTADVQFGPLRIEGDLDDPLEAIFTLTIIIPAGRFT